MLMISYQSIVKYHLKSIDSDRKCTDILCIIIGVGLTVALAVFAVLLFTQCKTIFINSAQYEK